MWWCFQWHQYKIKNSHVLHTLSRKCSEVFTLLYADPGFLWDFSFICVKAFISCYFSGFFIALLRLNMMWLTWENELSNVPLQSESHARTSSLLVITHTEVLFCTEYVCTAPLPTVCYYFKCKKTHILPLFDVKVRLMSSNEALFVLFLI